MPWASTMSGLGIVHRDEAVCAVVQVAACLLNLATAQDRFRFRFLAGVGVRVRTAMHHFNLNAVVEPGQHVLSCLVNQPQRIGVHRCQPSSLIDIYGLLQRFPQLVIVHAASFFHSLNADIAANPGVWPVSLRKAFHSSSSSWRALSAFCWRAVLMAFSASLRVAVSGTSPRRTAAQWVPKLLVLPVVSSRETGVFSPACPQRW